VCLGINFKFADPAVAKRTFDLETGSVQTLLEIISRIVPKWPENLSPIECEEVRNNGCGLSGQWFVKKKFWHSDAFLRLEFYLRAFYFMRKNLKLCRDCRFYSNERPFSSLCKRVIQNIERSPVNNMPLNAYDSNCMHQRRHSTCGVTAIHFIPKKATEQTTFDLLSK
jgi:hypothetical protein